MKISEAIAQVNSLKPNTFSETDKLTWLSRVDMQAKRELIDTHEGGKDFAGYTDTTPLDTELLIPAPYDECYIRYMEAQIDYHNGEMSKYKNAMILFNTVYAAFGDWYNRTHKPKSGSWQF